ncbi:MAG: type II secretion system protein N, partial [Steroidobacteraceae bacterium]
MNRRVLLIAAGIVAFLVFVIAMVPAGQITRWLPEQVAMSGVGGTLWSGRASNLSIDGHALGATDWSCRPWRLVVLEWSCRVTVQPPGGQVSGELSGEFDGAIDGRDISGRMPIGILQGVVTPQGWSGMLELDVERLRIVEARPDDAAGTLVLRSLKAPGPAGELLGDFELVVGEGAVGTDTLTGRLRDR